MKGLIRQQLSAALWDNDPANIDPDELVEALLPVVVHLGRQFAAEEVRTVRQWLLETGRADADTLRQLRDRVDQIAEEAS